MVSAYIDCPHCKEKNRVESAPNACLHLHKCEYCGKLIQTPPGYCCIICAFSGEKCDVSIKKSIHIH